MRRRNLAVELLEKLLKGALATRRRKNVVQAPAGAQRGSLSFRVGLVVGISSVDLGLLALLGPGRAAHST